VLRIIVEIKGGAVQCVGLNQPGRVYVLDWDNLETDADSADEDPTFETTRFTDKQISRLVDEWSEEVRALKEDDDG